MKSLNECERLIAVGRIRRTEVTAARALIEHVATWRHGGGDPGYDAADALIQAYDEYPHQAEDGR
ncbi:hypothetical protein [Catenuloplanes japonicus]|uniref:hypothetical protein n=1 Tax=Catenuloplanes japonicus TaxID=33876 RepID=UPI000526246E|nr:hypothetical protein [Catenuloplanes japonicus]